MGLFDTARRLIQSVTRAAFAAVGVLVIAACQPAHKSQQTLETRTIDAGRSVSHLVDQAPDTTRWREEVLSPDLTIRMPVGAELLTRSPISVRMKSGYKLYFQGDVGAVARARRLYDGDGSVKERILDATDAIVVVRVEEPDPYRIGRYCEVSACSSRVCVFMEGAKVEHVTSKLTDDECLAVVSMVRSVK